MTKEPTEVTHLKINQTTFGKPSGDGPPWPETAGNCWQASVAGILGLPLGAVPHFVTFEEPQTCYQDFLLNQGFIISSVRCFDVDRMPDSLFGIGCGVNGVDVPHVVAWKGKSLWHDPNPNGNGFKLEFVDYFIQLIDFYR